VWNIPSPEKLACIPRLYETENIPLKDKLIYLHLFIGGCDWFICEYDPEEEIFFGYANLNDDINAEWGYISFRELKDIKVSVSTYSKEKNLVEVKEWMEVDCDLHWQVRKASEVEVIKY